MDKLLDCTALETHDFSSVVSEQRTNRSPLEWQSNADFKISNPFKLQASGNWE